MQLSFRPLLAALLALLLIPVFPAFSLQEATAAAKQSTSQAQNSSQKSAKSSARSVKSDASSSRKKKSATSSRKSAKASKKRGSKVSAARRFSGPYKGAVAYDYRTKKIVFSDKANIKVPPASLTKILSLYVAEDALAARKINRNTIVTVSAKAASTGGSRMGLAKGDRVSLEELIRGMAVSSGNDASIAVAEYLGGSEARFVQMMNKKARALGMTGSTFKNANGLPAPGQYTTANDMLILARSYLAAYPGNLKKYHNQTCNTYKGCLTTNANPLLGVLPGADGLKSGFVSAAGYNLIATAERNGQRIVGVLLGAPSSKVRAQKAAAIMENAFSGTTVASSSSVSPKKSSSSKTNKSSLKNSGTSSGKAKGKGKGKTAQQNTSADAAKPDAQKRPS